MSRTVSRSVGVVTTLVALVVVAVGASRVATQSPKAFVYSTANGDWPSYNGDVRGSRYSPLDQINASNFSKLEVAWSLKTDMFGNRPEFKLEGTPLVVKGVLYATAGSRRAAIAVDAETGELLWVHGEKEGDRGAAAPRQLSGRGLAYWTNGAGDDRILYYTPGYTLIALNAKTGQRIQGFGVNGQVDLKKEDDQKIMPDETTGEIGIQSAPVVADDVVIVGASFREGMTPKTMHNNKGFVRGYDVRTGKRLWIFHTIPMKGEPGYETWLDGSAENNGNTGLWTQVSVDEEAGLAYLPIESPTGDYYGGHRPGNDLYGETLVCVDVRTGAQKWHFQLVHHPLWDMDISSAPVLADVTVNGQPRKVVAQPTKQGFLYVFDRVTGKPIWDMPETPVAKGDVPGEWYSPTQPIPSKPKAYSRNGVTEDALIDFTPAMHQAALDLVKKYRIGPVFTPGALSKEDGPLATLAMGTASGGTNWPGGSYDPDTHSVIAYACNSCVTSIGLVPPPNKEFSDMNYVSGIAGRPVTPARGPGENAGADSPLPTRGGGGGGRGGGGGGAGAAGGGGGGRGNRGGGGNAAPATAGAVNPCGAGAPGGGGGGLTVCGLPLIKPPYSTISSINLDSGDISWQIAYGETPDNIRSNPALAGMNIPRTGQSGYNIGTLITKSLVVAGEGSVTTTPDHPRGAMLRAYDKKTGKEVGAVWMPAQQSGSPMTYTVNGRQYIVVAVSGGAYSGEYIAFALPRQQ